jgi:hypothetical protein
LYCGQIGATVSEEQAVSIFRVNERSRFLQKFGNYYTSQKTAIRWYITLRNSSLNNLVRFSKFAEVG